MLSIPLVELAYLNFYKKNKIIKDLLGGLRKPKIYYLWVGLTSRPLFLKQY